ncbi:hypothetical protein [Spiroplasma endosymbiont of Nebria brevicollis]|uniref:hypothetical protein n=1 Tax=Spiroplasma endosymbiont of Nebria brevicollis TaxID=3066284 RepID=UPI00313D2CD5
MKKIQVSLTLEKILILIGAVLFSFFGLLYSINFINYNFFGLQESGVWFILIGIMYILATFSTKVSPGIWVKVWSILFIIISTIILLGLFIGKNVNYGYPWLYISIIPHIILILGSVMWILKSYK